MPSLGKVKTSIQEDGQDVQSIFRIANDVLELTQHLMRFKTRKSTEEETTLPNDI